MWFWTAFGLTFTITLIVLLLLVEFGAPIPKDWTDVDWCCHGEHEPDEEEENKWMP